ncbi:MAG: hypothetical protein ACOC2W_00150 [bacterium]
MRLNLLDIDQYIERNNIKQVTSSKYQLGEKRIDSGGLFSEEIFGRIASNERKTRFGYIDLKSTLIHPEAWDLVCGIDTSISKILNGSGTYTLTDDGLLKPSDAGNTGVYFFISIIDKIDFKKFKKDQKVDFFLKNKDKILINKFLVWPAGIRDVQISRSSDFIKMESAEINKLYVKLLNQTKSLPNDIEDVPPELLQIMLSNIQRTCLEINSWIKSRMKGKTGLIRGGSLTKSTDYSARFVIIPDPKLDLGQVGLPWQVVLKLFEPFTIHHLFNNDKYKDLLKEIKELIKSEIDLDTNSLKRFIGKMNDNPDIIPFDLKDKFIELAYEVAEGKLVAYKRDPVENRDSWVAADIVVDTKGFVMKINPVDCSRNGADFDGDTMAVYPLFSKEATKDAKEKLHPKHNSGNWTKTTQSSSLGYPIELDAAATIYRATK